MGRSWVRLGAQHRVILLHDARTPFARQTGAHTSIGSIRTLGCAEQLKITTGYPLPSGPGHRQPPSLAFLRARTKSRKSGPSPSRSHGGQAAAGRLPFTTFRHNTSSRRATPFTPSQSPVHRRAVGVGVGVRVGVGGALRVAVGVVVLDGVRVWVCVAVIVAALLGVTVAVRVGVAVVVGVRVGVIVGVRVGVRLWVLVWVGVRVAVRVGVRVGVIVGEGV